VRTIRLVALREFLENVKTKGFWVTIVLFPVILAGVFLLQATLSDAINVRHYLLIDQTGEYEDAVATAVEREHQRRILQAFVDYLLEYRLESGLETTAADAANAADQFIDDVDADEVAALDDWLSAGGLDYALLMASPYLQDDAPPFEPPQRQFVEAELPAGVDPAAGPEEIVEQLRPYLAGDRSVTADGRQAELFALILIPEDVEDDITRPGTLPPNPGGINGVQYWARNLTDAQLPGAISDSINSEIRQREYEALGLDSSLVRTVQRTRLPMSRLDPTAAAGEESVSLADTVRQFAPMAFVYLMFISLMQNVQYLLSNTIEEKSNRIIEVLLASVTPDELMMGKLLGIALAGLTTIAVWLLSLYVMINLYDSAESAMLSEAINIVLGSDLIPWFVFYYFTGYALYSGVFLAIGSLCNSLKEAQALMMPMILVQVVPLAMMAFVIMDPNNPLVRGLSWFPLFTPYLMMNRAAADPPLIDLVGTTLVLLLSIALVLWGSGKVFRQGVLRTGQPPRFLELLRMLRALIQVQATVDTAPGEQIEQDHLDEELLAAIRTAASGHVHAEDRPDPHIEEHEAVDALAIVQQQPDAGHVDGQRQEADQQAGPGAAYLS